MESGNNMPLIYIKKEVPENCLYCLLGYSYKHDGEPYCVYFGKKLEYDEKTNTIYRCLPCRASQVDD
jgi:hypothetical protein